jgi:hypothetical protein
MDQACLHGHLEIVKFLHSIGQNGTMFAMDHAYCRGHRYLKTLNLRRNHQKSKIFDFFDCLMILSLLS